MPQDNPTNLEPTITQAWNELKKFNSITREVILNGLRNLHVAETREELARLEEQHKEAGLLLKELEGIINPK